MPAAAQPQDATTPLSNRAMVVVLSTHRWHALKQDRKIAREVAEKHGDAAARHRHTRSLLADNALADLKKAFSAAETFHRENTSPWEDGGRRLLSNRRFSAYMEGIRDLQREVEAAAAKFAKGYPALVEFERQTNPHFNEADYPSVREIRRRFSIEVQHDKITDPADFRVIGIDRDDTASIQAQIAARTEDKLKGIVADLWKRVHECVFRISERLKAYEEREKRLEEAQAKADRRKGPNKGKLAADLDTRTGTFTDTIIQNLRDLVGVIPDLDITDSPDLAEMRAKLLSMLCPHEPEELRKSPLLRKRVTANADELLGDITKRIEDLGEFLA